MRLSNRKKSEFYKLVNTVLLMVLVFGIGAFFMDRYRFGIFGLYNWLLIIVPLLLIGFYYIRGRQIFEYDSDGEALNFKNRNVIPFLQKDLSDEFPKYKLVNYDVVYAFFYRRIYVNIASKKGHKIGLKYDISYLTSKELQDLKQSLNKVIAENEQKLHILEK